MMWLSGILIRVIALTLTVICFRAAWAGAWYYDGVLNIQKNRYEPAAASLETARRINPWDPQIAYQLGKSLLNASGDRAQALKRAHDIFTDLTEHQGYYGKYWIYLAMAEIEMIQDAGGSVEPEKWQELTGMLDRAHSLEAGSAWMNYMTGKLALTFPRSLSPKQKEAAIRRIKNSIENLPPRSLGLTPRYLKPALRFVWKQYRDIGLLRRITPHDYASYRRLLDFIDETGLWEEREQIYAVYWKLKQSEVDRLIQRGDQELHGRDYQEAQQNYQKALWIDRFDNHARLGKLVALAESGRVPGDFKEVLLSSVRDENALPATLLPNIQNLVSKADDNVIRGFFAYKGRDYVGAVKYLTPFASTDEQVRRVISHSHQILGRCDEASKILEADVEGKPSDVRNMILFAECRPLDAASVWEKIRAAASGSTARPGWWGSGLANAILQAKDSGYYSLNLLPGKAVIRFDLTDSSGAAVRRPYVVVRLNNEVIGSQCLRKNAINPLRLKIETTGGKRRLSVELLNGSAVPLGVSGYSVKLGKVAVDYPESAFSALNADERLIGHD